MGNLLRYSTPAERLRGLSLSEKGGILTGLNNYPFILEGNEFNSNEISIAIEFWPGFDWDEDETRYLFDTQLVERHYSFKSSGGSGNVLRIAFSNITVTQIPSASYSPFWRPFERNVLAVTAKSTVNRFYLNTNLIGTSSTAWPITLPTNLVLGSAFNGGFKYIGEIPYIKILKRILTPQEITDIQNNSTYDYINNPLIHYPMTAATHSGSQTLDISGNGLHGTLVGTPTKLSGKGYSFNGSTQHITFPEQTFTGEFSIAMFNKPNDTTLDGLIGHVSDSNKILLNSGNIFVRVVTNSDTTILAPGTVVNFTGLTRDADNKVDLYVNGKKYRLFNDVAQSGDSLWDFIGRTESGTQNLDGNIYDVFIDNKCLTPTQMHDMYVRGINVR